MTPPPRERLVETLAADKAAKTSMIAGPRVVVENLLALPKGTFHILSHPLSVGQIDLLGSIFRVCCFLSNYTTAPLRKGGVVGESAEAVAGDAGHACVCVMRGMRSFKLPRVTTGTQQSEMTQKSGDKLKVVVVVQDFKFRFNCMLVHWQPEPALAVTPNRPGSARGQPHAEQLELE